jgi:RNA polymerase sigma-70 factor (ECF subfamily)
MGCFSSCFMIFPSFPPLAFAEKKKIFCEEFPHFVRTISTMHEKEVSAMDTGEAIWMRYISGDESAFDELLYQYRLPLIFFIDRFLHDPDGSEDIAIDVFVELLAHPRRYRSGTSLKTYLFLLARSRAIDCLRHRKRLSVEPLPENLAASEELEAAILTDERKRAVNAAIAQLPEQTQQAIHLVYFEEMSYAQAAAVMGKTTKQIDNLLSRGKLALKDILGKEGAELL